MFPVLEIWTDISQSEHPWSAISFYTKLSALFQALRISSTARKESTVGEIVNLMAVDAQRFIDFSAYFNLCYSAPIVIILSMVFLWQILGRSLISWSPEMWMEILSLYQ